jgi:hypothetical protein
VTIQYASMPRKTPAAIFNTSRISVVLQSSLPAGSPLHRAAAISMSDALPRCQVQSRRVEIQGA